MFAIAHLFLFYIFYIINPIISFLLYHQKIIFWPNLLSGSGFYSIYPDLPQSAPDPLLSAPTGFRFILIQFRASF